MRRFLRAAQRALRRAVRLWVIRNRWRAESVDELPDTLKPQRLYLIGEGVPWSAALVCPCGCGELIHLSLLEKDSPSWRIHLDVDELPTLQPSVWRTKGCRSHFFLRHGTIHWCRLDATSGPRS